MHASLNCSCGSTLCVCSQVQHHLVWVWGDASPNAQLECLSKQPAVIEQLQRDDQVLYMHPWYVCQAWTQFLSVTNLIPF